MRDSLSTLTAITTIDMLHVITVTSLSADAICFRVNDENSLRFFHQKGLEATEAALAFIVLPDGITQVLLAKIWPHLLGHVDFGVA